MYACMHACMCVPCVMAIKQGKMYICMYVRMAVCVFIWRLNEESKLSQQKAEWGVKWPPRTSDSVHDVRKNAECSAIASLGAWSRPSLAYIHPSASYVISDWCPRCGKIYYNVYFSLLLLHLSFPAAAGTYKQHQPSQLYNVTGKFVEWSRSISVINVKFYCRTSWPIG